MNQLPAALITRFLPMILGRRNSRHLSVLIYHRVFPVRDEILPAVPTVGEFDWQMRLIARYFRPLSLQTALRLLDEDALPPKSVCVTFDDGYSDNERFALPILKKWQVPATIFVSTGFLNGGRMWNDTVIEVIRRTLKKSIDLSEFGLGVYPVLTEAEKRAALNSILGSIKYWEFKRRREVVRYMEKLVKELPVDLMMTDRQIRKVSQAGHEIGAHTVNHPILARLSDNEAEKEISGGKMYLESLLGEKLRYFAYPNGKPGEDYLPEHVSIVRESGFEAAFSTRWGVSNRVTDRMQLPRFTPWDRYEPKFATRLLLNTRKLI